MFVKFIKVWTTFRRVTYEWASALNDAISNGTMNSVYTSYEEC